MFGEHLSYRDRLRDLGLFSLKRWLRGDPVNVYQHLKRGHQEDGARPLLVVPTRRQEGMGEADAQEVASEHEKGLLHCTSDGAEE